MKPSATARTHANALAFDAIVLCRVIDNFGDVGVAWRLARQLAARGQGVALVLDDDSPLNWMRGSDADSVSVTVLPWQMDDSLWAQMGRTVRHCVIECFGCTAHDALLAALPRLGSVPRLVNLEYLSAESYVERSHGLASPQHHGAAQGLTRWFYYPGFTPKTGGLLEGRKIGWPDPGATDPSALWFAYAHPRWRDWTQHLRQFGVTSLKLCPGDAQRRSGLGPGEQQTLGDITLHALNYCDQEAFDPRLAHNRLNIVRGEDSFVRAQWAARPFIWHIYPQDDGAHWAKLDAFLDLFIPSGDPELAEPLRQLWHAFNDPHHAGALPPWPDATLWHAGCAAWRQHLAAQDDLVTQLLDFIRNRGQPASCPDGGSSAN